MTNKLSIIRQLLHEISYEGASVSKYREGGPGLENVLTAEVLQGLDFLPREQFFKAFVDALSGGNAARAKLKAQSEEAAFSFLPYPFLFRPDSQRPAET